ncbi:endonuclease/exonuclease/phosphatase family protein [Enterococcus sp. LJL98]
MNEITVATYNIRMDAWEDGDWSWTNRRSHVLDLIRYCDWDLFGVQEVLPHQLTDFEALTEYAFIGTAREDGKNTGEYNGIFYKKERFELLEEKIFWLSETPNVPSIHPEAGCHRLCVCGLFKEKLSGKTFVFADTHLDHESEKARVLGTNVILAEGLAHFKDQPIILVGDFNATPDEEAYQQLNQHLTDARQMPGAFVYGPKGTFQEFHYNCPWEELVEIDFIFVSPTIQVKKVGTLTYSCDQRFPSDHFPVEASLSI